VVLDGVGFPWWMDLVSLLHFFAMAVGDARFVGWVIRRWVPPPPLLQDDGGIHGACGVPDGSEPMVDLCRGGHFRSFLTDSMAPWADVHH
jgi:hypothetical protein